jgi:putative ABC transport system permease protein
MASHFHIAANLFWGEAVRMLARNRTRSSLTALGIAIGTAAVVWVVAVGQAGTERAEAKLHDLGDNLVWVEAGSRNVNGVRTGSHGTTSLTVEDAEAILRDVPLIKSMSPQVDGNVQVVFGNRNWNTHYRGVNPDYFDIKRWQLAAGAPLIEDAIKQAASLCVIGNTVRERLFGAEEAVGKEIRIKAWPCQVIGVLAPKGQSATGQDQDDTILLPYTTAQKRLRGAGYTWLDDILCSAVSAQDVNPAIDRVIELLRERHRIRAGQDDDFNIRRPDEIIKAEIEASNTLALLLVCIACISLLVGGIGIMNVMLASVSERTREIGVRLAVGATSGDVQNQFLGEAVILSLFGGLLGILLSFVGSFVIGQVLDWPLAVLPQALALAVAFSVSAGIIFGFYPARKAARLDPIVALRYE